MQLTFRRWNAKEEGDHSEYKAFFENQVRVPWNDERAS
jgi:hypothetical protein